MLKTMKNFGVCLLSHLFQVTWKISEKQGFGLNHKQSQYIHRECKLHFIVCYYSPLLTYLYCDLHLCLHLMSPIGRNRALSCNKNVIYTHDVYIAIAYDLTWKTDEILKQWQTWVLIFIHKKEVH